jgi:glycosyltransferase involved in cell wall biosynthesis
MRILWVTTSLGPDGPGRSLAALVGHWPGRDVLAVCALREVDAEFARSIPARVELHALRMRGLWDPRGATALATLCRRWRPDLLHTQLSRADWIGRLVGRWQRRPVLSTIQNVHSRMYAAEFSWPVARLGQTLDRLTSRWVERFIAVSEGVRLDLLQQGVPASRVVVIHNGLDARRAGDAARRAPVRRAWGVAVDDVVVGTVALLKTQKGVADLIEAARHVVAARSRAWFVQIGDGPLAADARARVRAAGLGDRFRLLDRVPDPTDLLPGLDVFALPSLWEGLPIALLEAMAAGLPCVGTRVSGIEEVIADGTSGHLVPPGDPAALAVALLDLIDRPDRRHAFGAASRERVREFDAETIGGRYRQTYLDVLGRRSARP